MKEIYSIEEFKKNKKRANQMPNDEVEKEIKKLLSRQRTSPAKIKKMESNLSLLKDEVWDIRSKTVTSILKVVLALSCCPLVVLALYISFSPYILSNYELKKILNFVLTCFTLLVLTNLAEIKYGVVSRLIK